MLFVFLIVTALIAVVAHIPFVALLLIWLAAYCFLYLQWTWY